MADTIRTARSPTKVTSAPAKKKAAGKKRVLDDVDFESDVGTELPSPKRARKVDTKTPARRSITKPKSVKKVDTKASKSVNNESTPAPPTPAAGRKRGRATTNVGDTTRSKRQRVFSVDTKDTDSTKNAEAPSALPARGTRSAVRISAKKAANKALTPAEPTLVPEEAVDTVLSADAQPDTPAPRRATRASKKAVASEELVVAGPSTEPKGTVDTQVTTALTPRKRRPATSGQQKITTSSLATTEPVMEQEEAVIKAASSVDDQTITASTPRKRAASKRATATTRTRRGSPVKRSPVKRAPKTTAQLSPIPEEKMPVIDPAAAAESDLTALLQQGPDTKGKGKGRAARKQPVQRARKAVGRKVAAKPEATSKLSGVEAGREPASEKEEKKKDVKVAASSDDREQTYLSPAAAGPSAGSNSYFTSTKAAGKKRAWEEEKETELDESESRPTKRTKTSTSAGRNGPIPQQSARSGPVDSETGGDDVHDKDTTAGQEEPNDDSDSADANSNCSSCSNSSSSDDSCSSSSSSSDNDDNPTTTYPQGTYPTACLQSNTLFNPLQARVPSSLTITLHLQHADTASNHPTSYPIPVRIPVRLLLRTSIRTQSLYARHGLTALTAHNNTTNTIHLPPWATRDALVGYAKYVCSAGNRVVFCADADADDADADADDTWWTAGRVLGAYAVAVWMGDGDCCDGLASGMVRLVRRSGEEVGLGLELELGVREVAGFVGALGEVANAGWDGGVGDQEEIEGGSGDVGGVVAAVLAEGRPMRNLLLDLLCASPERAARTLAELSAAESGGFVRDGGGDVGFFEELEEACEKRIDGRLKKTPLFMGQEMRWCERYHFHPYWFALDEGDVLLPKSEGEGYIDRNCHALRALHKATGGRGEEEQMPETRGKKELIAEEKETFRRWQKWQFENREEDMETYEQWKGRMKDREQYMELLREKQGASGIKRVDDSATRVSWKDGSSSVEGSDSEGENED
ncbi:uncharacterized protein BKCO1_5600022 [Diplodia corticola]|uniref:Uncharacterized protein n=1 Tax=Diplodia corticola TaxID=236234 RepID=A0A1J9QP86_9PEZI|nr:uncharacterized protein BKCO1_5600022 [Diplodia corticola]OJD30726.1 hypothetical protein BKCO1_5600022 [Diplodia corticola]